MEMFDNFEFYGDEQGEDIETLLMEWQKELRGLRRQIIESEAKQRELEQTQRRILAQARSLQQSMTRDGASNGASNGAGDGGSNADDSRLSDYVHCLHELDHLFKQTTLSLEHEAMKYRFLQRHYQRLATTLKQLFQHLDSPHWDKDAESECETPQPSQPLEKEALPSPCLVAPSYAESSLRERLKRPYRGLKRFALWASGSFVGAIAAVSLLCSALLAAGADGAAHAVLNTALVFGARYLMALLGLWVCTAVREAF